MNTKKIKTKAKKIWHFLVHEDSWQSFLADAIIIILVGKFVVFPLLGLMLGTPFPVVAVVSTSMDHDGDFESWWETHEEWYEEHNISKDVFQTYPYSNGFDKGDVFVVKMVPIYNLTTGDVVVYSANKPNPIIHRAIFIAETNFQTKGDANIDQIYFEKNITQDQYLGKAIARIPKIGWVKVVFIDIIETIKANR